LPLLKMSSEVTLLAGQNREALPLWMRLPPIDVDQYLRRHGVNVRATTLEVPDAEASDAILKSAQSSKAELIVMGAFGRSRFREWVLGGATRHVLEHMTIPVFMAH
jgi:nucleotide-binding universal stress UspA family protein